MTHFSDRGIQSHLVTRSQANSTWHGEIGNNLRSEKLIILLHSNNADMHVESEYKANGSPGDQCRQA